MTMRMAQSMRMRMVPQAEVEEEGLAAAPYTLRIRTNTPA